MKAFYTKKGIDVFKDAVSIPGVGMQYVLRDAIDQGADLTSPCKESYDILKGVVVDGSMGLHKIPRGRCHRNQEPPREESQGVAENS